MRRLSAKAFEMSAAARSWSPDDAAGANVNASVAAPQQSAVYRQAHLEGFDAGFADGDCEARAALYEAQERARIALDAAQAERERWCDQITAIAAHFADTRTKLDAEMEALAVAIAYSAVCKIVGQMHAERSLIPALCREVVATLSAQAVQVRVAEADKPLFQEAGLALDVMADPGLQSGDCVIVTPLGEIEASIDVQLHALLQSLLKTLRNGGPSR